MMESIYTVSEITKLIKITLEQNPELNNIWIKGEISNLTYHSSGHIYLSLKDKLIMICNNNSIDHVLYNLNKGD